MGRATEARREMAAARNGWESSDPDEIADMNATLAEMELNLGRLDAAESAAQTAVRGWKGHPDRRRSVLGDITFATIHVRAGEPDGLQLAHGAVTSAAHLRSQRARDRLTPLDHNTRIPPQQRSPRTRTDGTESGVDQGVMPVQPSRRRGLAVGSV